MSCFAGVIQMDGAPADLGLVGRMLAAMKNRAPEGAEVWTSGNVALGHARLDIPGESVGEHLPVSLDGRTWITADARIDGRPVLMARLRAAGHDVAASSSAAELILHTYAAFGDRFLDHLIGDFAFALWDQRQARLICARDQFGLRPFFHARVGNCLLFASDLRAVLQHPSVSRDLDEVAIGDFLIFGDFMDAERTIYRRAHRLPPAHRLKVVGSEICSERYWALPPPAAPRRTGFGAAVEEFTEIFGEAVADRCRPDRIALELTGGMDSSSIAVTCRMRSKPWTRFSAYTSCTVDLFPEDREGSLAGRVATGLGIPHQADSVAGYRLFERSDKNDLVTAEPFMNPSLAAFSDRIETMAQRGERVGLTGQGGDALFAGIKSHPNFPQNPIVRFAAWLETARLHLRIHRTLRGLGLRAIAFPRSRPPPWRPPFPAWIRSDFVQRTRMVQRYESIWSEYESSTDARTQLERSWIARGLFEAHEILDLPYRFRHPFYDVRLARLLLELPNHWVHNKRLPRAAMSGKLTDNVRMRPKVGAAGDVVLAKASRGDLPIEWLLRTLTPMSEFIDPAAFRSAWNDYLGGKGIESSWHSGAMIAPIALGLWGGKS